MSKISAAKIANKHWVNVDLNGKCWSIPRASRRQRDKCAHIYAPVDYKDIKVGWRRACRKCGAFAR